MKNITTKKLILKQKNWILSIIYTLLILISFIWLFILILCQISFIKITIILKYSHFFIEHKLFDILYFFYKVSLNNLSIIFLIFLILLLNYFVDDESKIFNKFILIEYWNYLLFLIILFIISFNLLLDMLSINESVLDPNNFNKILVSNPLIQIEQIFTFEDVLYLINQYLNNEDYEISSHLRQVFEASYKNPLNVRDYVNLLNSNMKDFYEFLNIQKKIVINVQSQFVKNNVLLYKQLCGVDIIEWKKEYTINDFKRDVSIISNFILKINDCIAKDPNITYQIKYTTQIFNQEFYIIEYNYTLASKQDWNMYYKALKNVHLYSTEIINLNKPYWTPELVNKYQYMNYYIQLTDPNIFDKIHEFINSWTNNNNIDNNNINNNNINNNNINNNNINNNNN